MEDPPPLAHSANDRNSALKKCKCIKTGMGTATERCSLRWASRRRSHIRTQTHIYTNIPSLTHTHTYIIWLRRLGWVQTHNFFFSFSTVTLEKTVSVFRSFLPVTKWRPRLSVCPMAHRQVVEHEKTVKRHGQRV